jgi:hypothetical protein
MLIASTCTPETAARRGSSGGTDPGAAPRALAKCHGTLARLSTAAAHTPPATARCHVVPAVHRPAAASASHRAKGGRQQIPGPPQPGKQHTINAKATPARNGRRGPQEHAISRNPSTSAAGIT